MISPTLVFLGLFLLLNKFFDQLTLPFVLSIFIKKPSFDAKKTNRSVTNGLKLVENGNSQLTKPFILLIENVDTELLKKIFPFLATMGEE